MREDWQNIGSTYKAWQIEHTATTRLYSRDARMPDGHVKRCVVTVPAYVIFQNRQQEIEQSVDEQAASLLAETPGAQWITYD